MRDVPDSSTMVGAGRMATVEVAAGGAGVAGGMVVGDAPVQPVSNVSRSKTEANGQFPCIILHRVVAASPRAMFFLSGVLAINVNYYGRGLHVVAHAAQEAGVKWHQPFRCETPWSRRRGSRLSWPAARF